MAIRFRSGRKAPWIVYWKNPHTGKTEEEAYTAEAEAKKANSLIKHRLKFERETFHHEESPGHATTDTLEACYFLYLKAKNFSPKGVAWSMYGMRLALERMGDMSIREITKQHLENLKDALSAKDIKPVSVRSCMSVVRAVLRWCAYKGIIEQPPQFPKLPPPHYQHFIPPTPEEIAAICSVAESHLIRVIILGSQLGVRVGPSELYGIRWSDVDFSRAVVRVTAAKKRPDQPWREVPIRDSLHPVLLDWKEQDNATGAEYVINWKGRQIVSAKRTWNTALRRAGINRKMRPYDLRHAFATEAIAAGVDVGTVAQIMGNDPKTLLEHYQHVTDARKRAAVEVLPDIPMPKHLRQKITAKNTNV